MKTVGDTEEDFYIFRAELNSDGTGTLKNSSGETVAEWLTDNSATNAYIADLYNQVGDTDLEQSTSGSQLLYEQSGINGLPSFRASTTLDYLTGTPSIADTHSYFITTQLIGAPLSGYHNLIGIGFIDFSNPSTQFSQIIPNFSSPTNILWNNFSNASLDIVSSSVELEVGVPTTLSSIKNNSSGGTSNFYKNNDLVGSGTGTQAINDTVFLCAWFTNTYNGYVSELLIFNEAVDDTKRNSILDSQSIYGIGG